MTQQLVVGDRWITVPGVIAVPVNSDSPAYRIKWNLDGQIVAVGGCVLGIIPPDTLSAGLSSIAIRCVINGERELFSDGENGAFMPFATLFSELQRTQSFNYRVKAQDVWNVYFRNYNTANAYRPHFAFSVKQ